MRTRSTRGAILAAAALSIAAVVAVGAGPADAVSTRRTGSTASPSPEVGATLRADYKFRGSRRSPSPAAPDLRDVGPGANTFVTENVDGVNRTVLRFPEGNGLQLPEAQRLLPRNRYTIAVKLRLDDTTSYNRVVDLTRGESDEGLYVHNEMLNFYPAPDPYIYTIDTDEWVNVVLTRSRAGRLRGYVDAELQFDVTDPELGLLSQRNTLRFFRDNNREESSGAVSRIRLFDNSMLPEQVLGLGT